MIVPEQWREDSQDWPTFAAIIRNDSAFICHHLMTLGYMYGEKLPKAVSDFVIFVDMIPLFRDIGESLLTCQVVRWTEWRDQ
jgi:hypothetical protein